MKKNIVAKVENLTKIYKLYGQPIDRLKESLNPFKKRYHKDFHALDNITFEIKKGEIVGILGKNGSGKSTLLKLITGVLSPSFGKVVVRGKISAILELGAGFNSEMTGLENIYLNTAINGMTKKETDQKISEIIEFAELGEFIYQPLKTYSSGMRARLAFAVSISIDPDILIVDEALSVGDSSFQLKCFNWFENFNKKGKTVLYVSHSVSSIIKYCTRSLVINNGKLIHDGNVQDGVDIYKKSLVTHTMEKKLDIVSLSKRNIFLKKNLELNKHYKEYGTKELEIYDFAILNDMNEIIYTINQDMFVNILIKAKSYITINNAIFAFTIKTLDGLDLIGTNTLYSKNDVGLINEGEFIDVKFRGKIGLTAGKYVVSLGCVTMKENSQLHIYHRLYDVFFIEIISNKKEVGMFNMDVNIEIEKKGYNG